MKQVVLESPGHFEQRDAPVPVPTTGNAIVRMKRVGLCGSDFHAFGGRHPTYTYPRVLGHELSGIVVEISANERDIRVGDKCAIEPYWSCGDCVACRKGRHNCCENLRVFGVHLDGGMQEFLSVPITLLHKSEVLSLDQLALIETLGIGAHAVTRSGLKPGEKALIVGAGPIGISVVQFASALGAKVHVIERSESRRRFIQKLGFTATESMAGNLFDVVFDATGNSVAMGESLRYVATGGSLVFVGLSKDPVSFDDALFHRREITIFASRNSVGLFPGIIKLVEEGKIDTSHWITHRLPLSQVAYDFAPLTASQSLVKAIVDFQDYPELEEAVSSQ